MSAVIPRPPRTMSKLDPGTDHGRRLINQLTGQGPEWRRGFCIFCGGLTFGRVCRAHLDLVQLDRQITEPAASSAKKSATGSE